MDNNISLEDTVLSNTFDIIIVVAPNCRLLTKSNQIL